MSDQPISIHYQQMEEWLNDRRSVFGKKNKKEFTALLALAPKLVQQVQYDIPAIQKQVKRCSNSLEDCHRVCEDVVRVVASITEKRRKLLSEYELSAEAADDGADGSTALQAAVDRRIEESRRRLTKELLDFANGHLDAFKAAYNDILEKNSKHQTELPSDAFSLHFPWLERLLAECALPVRRDACDPDAYSAEGNEEESAASPQIDWGDGADLGSDAFPSSSPGLGTEEAAHAVEINWDAGDEDAAAGGNAANDEAAAAAPPPAANGQFFSLDIARARDRTNLLTELNGCKCFAGERLELKDGRFSAFCIAVDDLLTAVTSSIEAEFLRMHTNFRERDLFEERVACFDRAIRAAHTRKQSHQTKYQESKRELEKLEPQLAALQNLARVTRDQCLENLSAIFPGRSILIVGDINKYV